MTARLSRGRRIRRRAEFLRIQDSPARVNTRHLLFLLAARSDGQPARIGVVASRKVGPAVSRNRAKRLVREAFRLHQSALPIGVDVVIIVRPGTHRLKLSDVEEELVFAVPAIRQRLWNLLRSAGARGVPGA